MTEYEKYLCGFVAEKFADNEAQWTIFLNRFGVMFWEGYKLNVEYIEREIKKTSHNNKIIPYILNELVKFKTDYLKVIDKRMVVDHQRIFKDYQVNKKYRWLIKKTLIAMPRKVNQVGIETTIKDLWLTKNYIINFVKDAKVRKKYCLEYLIDLDRKDDDPIPWTYINHQRINFLSV